MRKFARGATRLSIYYVGLSILASLAARGADRKETIRQAHRSYYNLKSEGLTEFRCHVQLDWDSLYKGLKVNAVGRDQLLPILRKVHFQVLVGPDGGSTVSHESELAPPNEEVAERVRRSIAGVEQILTGFLQTWSGFMINSPFPRVDDEYQLEDLDDKLRLSYKEGTGNIVISMTRDFVMDEVSVATPQFEGTVRPKFSRNKRGFVLASYDVVYKAESGNPQQLAVKIEYQNVEGFDLPSTIEATVTSPGGVVDVHLTFTDYRVKKR